MLTGMQTSVLGSQNGVCYYATPRYVGAIRERDGKTLWEKSFDYVPAAQLGPSFIVVSQVDRKERASLRLLDLRTGQPMASRTAPKAVSLAVDGKSIYALCGGTVQFFSPQLAPLATIKLADKVQEWGGHLWGSEDVVVAALRGDKWVGIDKKTRKVSWERRNKYADNDPVVISGGKVLLAGDASAVYDVRTGRKAWDFNDSEWLGVCGNVCLSHEDRNYIGRDWRTGRRLWSLSGAPEYMGGRNAASVEADGKSFLIGGDHLTAVSLTGRRLWTADFYRPEVVHKDRWIVSDGDRLLGYAPGKQIQIPTDPTARQQLAQRLVRDFEQLDGRERDLLIPLSREAIRPLLARYVKWDQEYEALSDKRDHDVRDRGQTVYGILESDAGQPLAKMLTPADTPLLVETIRQVKSDWWRSRVLVPLLVAHGDVDEAVPFFIEELKKSPKPDSDNSSISVIAKSRRPEAVKFLIDALQNPNAPETWRQEAFIHLAGTGGEAGVAAVRAAMPKPGPRARWQSRIKIEGTSRRAKPREATDTQGRTWVLFQSAVLGNGTDYFMAQKIGKRYEEPIFLGFYDGDTWGKPAPTEYRKIPMAKLITTEWIRLFPNDPAIRKDSDGDGLTDLVEARLGTNPQVADTDGDGVRDDIDPCPNAAPRTLGDREKIVAAAVAAHFFGNDWGVPAVISVKNVTPFEMAGYPEPLIWTSEGTEGPLSSMYGTGVNRIDFQPVLRGDDAKITEETDWLEISPDGKTARTIISRYSGGLNGEGMEVTLRKVGDDWFVVDMKMAYVS